MLRAVRIAAVGAASIAAVYLSLPLPVEREATPAVEVRPRLSTGEFRLVALPDGASPADEMVKPRHDVTVRDVTPPGVTAPPPQSAAPIRIEPPPRAPSPARTQRLYNPVVIAAGKIRADKRTIALAGVSAPEFSERCGEDAAAWPCGRMARAALRRFVRGRAVECEVPPGASDVPDPATCRVAGQNLSEWLVAQGWARRADDSYVSAEEAARELKLGLWGDRRPDVQATAVAAAPESSPVRALAISERVSGTP